MKYQVILGHSLVIAEFRNRNEAHAWAGMKNGQLEYMNIENRLLGRHIVEWNYSVQEVGE